MLTLKQYDDGIGIKATLSNTNGTIDLTGATVDFYFQENVIRCDKTDEVNGVVLVTFTNTHTSTTGKSRGVFKVQFSDGRCETFPSVGYVEMQIQPNIGGI